MSSASMFDGHQPDSSAGQLQGFRSGLYHALSGWGDALFELGTRPCARRHPSARCRR
jgi:hypothetical protein